MYLLEVEKVNNIQQIIDDYIFPLVLIFIGILGSIIAWLVNQLVKEVRIKFKQLDTMSSQHLKSMEMFIEEIVELKSDVSGLKKDFHYLRENIQDLKNRS